MSGWDNDQKNFKPYYLVRHLQLRIFSYPSTFCCLLYYLVHAARYCTTVFCIYFCFGLLNYYSANTQPLCSVAACSMSKYLAALLNNNRITRRAGMPGGSTVSVGFQYGKYDYIYY